MAWRTWEWTSLSSSWSSALARPVGEKERALPGPVPVVAEGRELVLQAHLQIQALAAPADQRRIGGHPVEPRAERGPLLECGDLLEKREKHVLYHFLGVRLAPGDPERHAVDPRRVPLHEDLQRAGVPPPQTCDQLGFRRRRARLGPAGPVLAPRPFDARPHSLPLLSDCSLHSRAFARRCRCALC
jgi:hypothetical protein